MPLPVLRRQWRSADGVDAVGGTGGGRARSVAQRARGLEARLKVARWCDLKFRFRAGLGHIGYIDAGKRYRKVEEGRLFGPVDGRGEAGQVRPHEVALAPI